MQFPWDETVWLWDLGIGQRINTYNQGCHVNTVIIHESGGCFLSSGTMGNAKAWVLGTDQPLLDDLAQGMLRSSFGISAAGNASRHITTAVVQFMSRCTSQLFLCF
jgi:WD40 repeat protein